jgi:hypothetical protein
MKRNDIATALEASGIAAGAIGAGLIYGPLGLLVLAAGMILFGVALERR